MNTNHNLVNLLENEEKFRHLAGLVQLNLFRFENELRQRVKETNWVINESLYNSINISEKIDTDLEKHQRRVSLLACKIGRRIGLSEKRINIIRIAGLLHDVGLMFIPEEVTTLPNKLNDHEFDIVKTHSTISSEILKTAGFSWPIGEVVAQHHERINGSGYPFGLSGNEIWTEAKILAVADVVDSIMFDKSSQNVLDAIQEVVQNRGVLYDPDAVDACVTIILESNFESYNKRLCTKYEVTL
ncbi:MAG: HD domain-containing protein [Endomicrobiales bacterium]|nr:HD domain-containing protein [Endomicrobiales bacterium]